MAKKIAAKAKSSKAQPQDAPEETFEDALAELEQVVGELESGNLGLSEALEKYEKGVQVLKSCYQSLQIAEQKIEMLSAIGEDGEVKVRPVEDAE